MHDPWMTFKLARVHAIPIYFSVSLYMKPSQNFISLQIRFWNELIAIFSPNESFILVSY